MIGNRFVHVAKGDPKAIRKRLTERDLLDDAQHLARQYDVTLDDMLGNCRHQPCVRARQAMWCLLYDRGHWSINRIGEIFDRDHTTVSHGIRAATLRDAVRAPEEIPDLVVPAREAVGA